MSTSTTELYRLKPRMSVPKQLKLYLVKTVWPTNWGCADGFVVRAFDPTEAKRLTMGEWGDHERPGLAASLRARKIGICTDSNEPSIVLRSFVAG